jgi:hypothetical protein
VTGRGSVLAGRILAELQQLELLVQRAERGWVKAKECQDDFFLDGVALNLHGFYSGLERIFERIASGVEGTVPEGANWHQELLSQIAIEIPGVRPAVISVGLREELEPYRGFRHIVRNVVYAFHLSPEKMEPLVEKLPSVFSSIKNEMIAFGNFLLSIQ